MAAPVSSRRPSSSRVRPAQRRAILSPIAPTDFETFYRREYPTMVSLARAICGDYSQAEELAQDAMTKAHRNWDKVSAFEKPGAWVRRVTINLAISRRRRLLRELNFLRRSAREPAPAEPEQVDHEIWSAVAQLPPRQRAVIALFYQQDLSTASIAEALGCSVSTATSHLNQARTRLAHILEDRNGS